MTPEKLAAIGAFCSGVGAAVSAWIGSRRAKKNYEDECRKRFDAFREGLEVAHEEADRAEHHDHSQAQ